MIHFDVTKAHGAGHRSGLTRVSARLRDALGGRAQETRWDAASRSFRPLSGPLPGTGDWVLTPELFSEEERPGLAEFLARRSCRVAAIFHDAIPLKHPHITWPQSVARHPGYLKLLARCDRIWAVSAASRDELLGFWRWQGVTTPPPVEVLALGADFNSAARVQGPAPAASPVPSLVCVGILEPRKNQAFLLGICAELWTEGLGFDLHVVGRVNPHFGRPVLAQIKALQKRFPERLHYHGAADDATVAGLFRAARATAFPTLAEGCGLPLLESLWQGVPCLCSDLPVLQENAVGGGCLTSAPQDPIAWKTRLRQLVTDDALHARLRAEAMTRSLPTWAQAADTIAQGLA